MSRSGGPTTPEQPGKAPAHEGRSISGWQIAMRDQHPLDRPCEDLAD
jgi:hypothetical protein